MTLAITGFAMLLSFMTLVMTKRVSALVGLVVVPLLFVVAIGDGGKAGGYVVAGMTQVAPTAFMLLFAILYFGLMIDTGLFDPLVGFIVRRAGTDPLKATLGLTALTAAVSLDGDGSTTFLVCSSAMFPIFQRLRMNPLIFATLCGTTTAILNMTPWGGPSARAASALGVNPIDLFVPLLPTIVVGLLAVFALAWWFGLRERARLGTGGQAVADDATLIEAAIESFERDETAPRPKLVLVNLALTIILMTCVILHVAAPHVLFMTGFAIALMINYPRIADQRRRIIAHAGSVLNVTVMILAAGAFAGVLTGTGMIDAMARACVASLPPYLGPYLGVITALLSLPCSFFLSNDAYYFGVVPVIAGTAKAYGIAPEAIGRAAILGQPIHMLSPLVAAVYLQCALLGVELADVQRFVFRWALGIALVTILAALLTSAVPLTGHDVPRNPVPAAAPVPVTIR
ncbi:MAG: citrate-Mg2+:H+ or citrate-Ca2+:H+ symporter, CitMHS family [Sphingomonadales bacterium]|jgi:CitMHS family citrate-Mg2+:H+ or citrate-Ca2+:H+ symporter|nr:citrate-Mg2+:H+ or citrate-Ca2+:H+ symporter, CitMHS family [Sphingomonadales bacterium]